MTAHKALRIVFCFAYFLSEFGDESVDHVTDTARKDLRLLLQKLEVDPIQVQIAIIKFCGKVTQSKIKLAAEEKTVLIMEIDCRS